jgi:hypothetical protein
MHRHEEGMDDIVRGFGGNNFTAVETADFDKIAEELDPIKRFQRNADPNDMSRYDVKVRYGRFNLDDEVQRKELERVQTAVAMLDGMHPQTREEWTTTADGRIIVTLCWVELTPKSEKKSKRKKKGS